MNFLFCFLSLVFTWGSSDAEASGCAWHERYEPGRQIRQYEAVGRFNCNQFTCFFDKLTETEGKGWTYKTDYYFPKSEYPSPGVELRIPVAVYEGMTWLDCDGSDSAPDFKRNGTLYQLEQIGRKYQYFDPRENY